MSNIMNFSITVSHSQTKKLSRVIHQLNPQIEDFLDPRFFPGADEDPENIARFFFFITGIDHRTSPPGQSFEGLIDGRFFQGADLLWHLALRRYQDDLDFFSPHQMSRISETKVRHWLTVEHPVKVTIRNPAERARLLRDCGQKLVDHFNGSVLSFLEQAGHQISPNPLINKPGLIPLLANFQAYEDPASKKSFLLLKFLIRREIWFVEDTDNICIPVDNHLTRIALRTGIITVSSSLANQLRAGQLLTLNQDVELRHKIAQAYLIVGQLLKRSVLELDDFFWHFGRQCCLAEAPVCVHGCNAECYLATQLLTSPCIRQCPLRNGCIAFEDDLQRALIEPKVTTWYY